MKDETRAVKAQAAVCPLFITQQNSEAATGENFRFWKANFPHLVRRISRRDVIVAAELERDVAQHGLPGESPIDSVVTVDPAEAVRSILRRAGGQ